MFYMSTNTGTSVSDLEIERLIYISDGIAKRMSSRRKDCDVDELKSVALVAIWEAMSSWVPEKGPLVNRVSFTVRKRIKDHIRSTECSLGPRGGRLRNSKVNQVKKLAASKIVELSFDEDPELQYSVTDRGAASVRILQAAMANEYMEDLTYTEKVMLLDHYYSNSSMIDMGKSYGRSRCAIYLRLRTIIGKLRVKAAA